MPVVGYGFNSNGRYGQGCLIRERSRPGFLVRRQRVLSRPLQPYGGFPDGITVEDGYITMPELPGIGFDEKSDLYRAMRALID